MTTATEMPVMAVPVVDAGEWLVAHRFDMDRGESAWLAALADFDRDQGWAADGQLSCLEWLVLRTSMARPTAYEKIRIARELARRPVIAAAFGDGRLSYSAVRAITRMESPDPAVDATLVDVAVAGSVADVERAVRCYLLHADQDRSPAAVDARRGLRIVPGHDGTTRVEITLADFEAEELTVALQAFLDRGAARRDSSAGDSHAAPDDEAVAVEVAVDVDGEVDGDGDGDGLDSSAGESPRSGPGRRADAFVDMVAVALAHVDGHRPGGAERYLVHLVSGPGGGLALVDGTPVDGATAGRVGCDASVVCHHHSGEGEPLRLGRRSRTWSTAQRRAAAVRDGGRCRFPGCHRRVADLHHQWPWDDGGPTDLDNGFLACPRHHTLLHAGFRAIGNPNATLTFWRPDGIVIGTTTPLRRCAVGGGSPVGRRVALYGGFNAC